MTKFSKGKKMLFFIILLLITFVSFNEKGNFSQAFNKCDTKLVPIGNVVGIKLNTQGVLVIGIDENYLMQKAKGIKVGDIITKVNNQAVNKSSEIHNILTKSNNDTAELYIKRDGNYITKNIKLYKDEIDGSYKIGVWVRDKVAGIGTMTFYNPKTQEFAALGHGITDIDTGELMPIKDGKIYNPQKIGVKRGNIGVPGEILGEFIDSNALGDFKSNTNFGIKGKITDINRYKNLKPIPIAHFYEIKKGKAHILFQDEKGIVQKYEIKIEKIFNQENPESKSMLIEIVDPKLLQYTGGIVQGMSGSPIIQNGKLIGAVTHVFVNDPKKGYAIFIDWMVK